MDTADAPAEPVVSTRPISRRRRFVLFALTTLLLLIGLVLSLLYRITHQNFLRASLDGYPSSKQIISRLRCPTSPSAALQEFEEGLDDRPPLFKLPLRTQGRNIVGPTGERVKLMSTNWYGASDEDFVPGGLDIRHRREIAAAIRAMGFNSVRLPYSDEMVMTNPDVPEKFWSQNLDLADLIPKSQRRKGERRAGKVRRTWSPPAGGRVGEQEGEGEGEAVGGNPANATTAKALDIFDAVITALTDEGIAVIVNNHITQARWCCDANLCDATWANDYLGGICRVRQTEEQWIQNWEKVMRPHLNNPLVIGADLRNENRSPSGQMLWPTWAAAAQKAANRLHKLQPDWLIFVEGVASANYLQGVKSHPVTLTVPNRVVYSAHVYGWSGWGSLVKGPYWSRDYASFSYDMFDNWGYLLEEDIAPVWVGEFGGPDQPNTGDLNYWTNLMSFLEDMDADWGYWALNPRKPSGNETESYSLLRDDWITPSCDYRLYDMMLSLGLRPYRSTSLHTMPSTSAPIPTETTGFIAPGGDKQAPLGHF